MNLENIEPQSGSAILYKQKSKQIVISVSKEIQHTPKTQVKAKNWTWLFLTSSLRSNHSKAGSYPRTLKQRIHSACIYLFW